MAPIMGITPSQYDRSYHLVENIVRRWTTSNRESFLKRAQRWQHKETMACDSAGKGARD